MSALYGVDYGYSQDPSVMVKLWTHERVLYVEYESYAIGCDIDQLPRLFDRVPGAREAIVRADSARPETTSFLQQHGYPGMRSCEKWSGSVEDGCAHLRSYEAIVIHPRCEHAIQEARLWSYKTDARTGEITPQLIDRHNHVWDAARYACGPLIKRAGGAGLLAWYAEQLAGSGAPAPSVEPPTPTNAPIDLLHAEQAPAAHPQTIQTGGTLWHRALREGAAVKDL